MIFANTRDTLTLTWFNAVVNIAIDIMLEIKLLQEELLIHLGHEILSMWLVLYICMCCNLQRSKIEYSYMRMLRLYSRAVYYLNTNCVVSDINWDSYVCMCVVYKY